MPGHLKTQLEQSNAFINCNGGARWGGDGRGARGGEARETEGGSRRSNTQLKERTGDTQHK
jgi:hypothetical protein